MEDSPGTRPPAPHQMRGTAFARRVGGGMLIAGAALGVVTTVLPHGDRSGDASILAVSCFALLLGALLIARPFLAPDWMTPWFVVLGTALITVATLSTELGSGSADNEVLYLLPVLYSFYFLPARQALFQLGLVGVAYAAVLSDEVSLDIAAIRWVTTFGTLSVAGALVGSLNRRVDRLIEELDRTARRDALTGVLNRRGLDERLEIELARARRTGDPLTVVTADVDEFKALNDGRGHRAGDRALALATEVMAGALRDVDVLARTGGDEFVLVLPGCEQSAGLDIAEAVRTLLKERSKAEGSPVTVSLGVAGAPPLPLVATALVSAADSALYRAKGLGRDRCAVAGHREMREALSLDTMDV